jgi:hypothetical protein
VAEAKLIQWAKSFFTIYQRVMRVLSNLETASLIQELEFECAYQFLSNLRRVAFNLCNVRFIRFVPFTLSFFMLLMSKQFSSLF